MKILALLKHKTMPHKNDTITIFKLMRYPNKMSHLLPLNQQIGGIIRVECTWKVKNIGLG